MECEGFKICTELATSKPHNTVEALPRKNLDGPKNMSGSSRLTSRRSIGNFKVAALCMLRRRSEMWSGRIGRIYATKKHINVRPVTLVPPNYEYAGDPWERGL